MPGFRTTRRMEDRFWAQYSGGVGLEQAAAVAGVSWGTAKGWLRKRGGVKPTPSSDGNALSLDERIRIQAGVMAGESNAEIARQIGRHRSTVGEELKRNGWASARGPANQRRSYNALSAQRRADEQRRRPKPRKLDVNPTLHDEVQDKLDLDWSPEQITRWLHRIHGKDPEMTISHEAIYQCIYVNSAGGLRRALTARLRTGRKLRKPRRRPQERRGKIPDMPSIVERPDEAWGRAVPGYWEGDLIMGADNATAIGTLVDRCSRTIKLLHLPDGHSPEQVRDQMIAAVAGMPEALKLSITWDQGIEMHQHRAITEATGVQIYFCDPHSPWQRPTNENTNGLLRQYFPKGTDLSVHSRADLDHVEWLLNGRPRKSLDWLTPDEYLKQVLEEDITVALTV